MKVQLHNGADAWVIDCVYVKAYDGVALYGGSAFGSDVSVPMGRRQAKLESDLRRLVIERAEGCGDEEDQA